MASLTTQSRCLPATTAARHGWGGGNCSGPRSTVQPVLGEAASSIPEVPSLNAVPTPRKHHPGLARSSGFAWHCLAWPSVLGCYVLCVHRCIGYVTCRVCLPCCMRVCVYACVRMVWHGVVWHSLTSKDVNPQRGQPFLIQDHRKRRTDCSWGLTFPRFSGSWRVPLRPDSRKRCSRYLLLISGYKGQQLQTPPFTGIYLH